MYQVGLTLRVTCIKIRDSVKKVRVDCKLFARARIFAYSAMFLIGEIVFRPCKECAAAIAFWDSRTFFIVNVYKNAASYRSVENRRFVYKLREVVWILTSTECCGIIRTYGSLKVAFTDARVNGRDFFINKCASCQIGAHGTADFV